MGEKTNKSLECLLSSLFLVVSSSIKLFIVWYPLVPMAFVSSRYDVRETDVTDLPVADGLKEALLNYGITRNQILRYTTDELASILGVDQYVAKLIRGAAKQ